MITYFKFIRLLSPSKKENMSCCMRKILQLEIAFFWLWLKIWKESAAIPKNKMLF